MPTMDFEVYLPTDAGADERRAALAELARWEDQAGIELAVVMPKPIRRPDNRALFVTAADAEPFGPMSKAALADRLLGRLASLAGGARPSEERGAGR